MEQDAAFLPRPAGRSRANRRGRSVVCRSGTLNCAYRQPVARPSAFVWEVELGLQALPGLGEGRRLQAHVRGRRRGSRHGIRHGRRHHRQSPPPRPGRKRGTQSQAIGHSKGGLTTKILALTDALGSLVRFVLLPGNRYDTVGVEPLIQDIEFEGLIADKAFDADWIIDELNERGAKIVISQRPGRRAPLAIDREIYKWRHLIENFFCRLKEFKRIAMRSDKTDESYAAMIHLAAAVIGSR